MAGKRRSRPVAVALVCLALALLGWTLTFPSVVLYAGFHNTTGQYIRVVVSRIDGGGYVVTTLAPGERATLRIWEGESSDKADTLLFAIVATDEAGDVIHAEARQGRELRHAETIPLPPASER